jgi:hypothetical protein
MDKAWVMIPVTLHPQDDQTTNDRERGEKKAETTNWLLGTFKDVRQSSRNSSRVDYSHAQGLIPESKNEVNEA